ncbi:MAG: CoA transferase, partial [Planctomycetes bacterium]|nr:CoA transferase [Planctomycetota bacterium]
MSVANEADLVFERDIRPIFRNRCIRCHGPKEREAELSLKSHKEVMRGGESGRILVPGKPENSLLFLYLNTSKRGVTLNLKSRQGRQMLQELVRDADLLVENFSPRVMPSLGLDYDSLHEVNPALVMVSISNFGQTGPYRDYKATEIVEYALGGLMYIFGAYDREPLKHALHQAQFKAGTNAA